jgi:hypothetical protein
MRAPIDDKDLVFARFKSDKPAATSRRETLTIPGRRGTSGSRVVQVVHVRAGAAIPDRPRRIGVQARAAAWDGVFTARPTAPAVPTAEAAEGRGR